jgi:hypothetical protein
VYLPGQKNPIELRESHSALGMLAVARDEAHRASNALRLKLGKRKRLTSKLDEVRGVGAKTRAKLLKAFGSVRAIEEADPKSLQAAGATEQQALAIMRTLRGPLIPSEAARPLVPATVERVEQTNVDEVSGAEDAAVQNAFAIEDEAET